MRVEANPKLKLLHLPNLVAVGRSIKVEGNDALLAIEFPALLSLGTTYDGDFTVVNNYSVLTVSAPKLDAVPREIALWANDSLTTVSLAALVEAGPGSGWAIEVRDNPALASLSLPTLTTANGSLVVRKNAKLFALSLPALTTVKGSMAVRDLADMSAPMLTEVGGSLTIDGGPEVLDIPLLTEVGADLLLANSDKTTKFNAPELAQVVGNITLSSNAVLEGLILSALSAIGGDFKVVYNPNLPQCLVDSLVAQVQGGEGVGGQTKTGFNNDSCTCEEIDGVLEATCP